VRPLPAALADRARAYLAAGPAGMYVFPGGAVDPRDTDGAVPWGGPEPVGWADRLGADQILVRALACAAVRETFEESGVLLAGPSAERMVTDPTTPDWEADRRRLLDRSLAFSTLLVRRGLVLRADLLRPWAHWITPEFEPRRYDTRFFLAALPRGQRARDVGGEADLVAWARPDVAVERFDRGELAMLPPTVQTLRELTAYDSVAAAIDAAERRTIRAVLPRVVRAGDELTLLVPGDAGYPG
jgi:8-oxo-dGTP pyrophosphatase MutT (NUDIX family)